MMSLREGFRWLMGREESEPLQKRNELQDLIVASGLGGSILTGPWSPATVSDAMSVPAIFRAISLIANTTGVLSLEAYRDGEKMPDIDTPRIVKRPDPFQTPRVFFRDTSANMAQYGEAWWWIAKRDADGNALSLINVDPRQIVVTENPRNLLKPVINWRQAVMPNDDMRQLTLLRDPNNPLRGTGPVQACGAAVSVAVEAQQWAADFYAGGGLPSVLIKTAMELAPGPEGEAEADLLRSQWMEKASNTPRVIDTSIDSVTPFSINPQSAQLMEARMHDVGEVARMFGIPGPLLEYSATGSSLTYTNKENLWTEFQQSCLTPNYLEPIEQEMTDLLTRQTVARFNISELLRADVKTRYEVYGIGIDKGIFPPEYAAAQEGIAGVSVETRPIPFAAPAAIPTSLPIQNRSQAMPDEVRCHGTRVKNNSGHVGECNYNFGRISPPYSMRCPKCYTQTENVIAGVIEERQTDLSTEMLRTITAVASRPVTINNNMDIAPPAVNFGEGAIQVAAPTSIEAGAIQLTIEAPEPAPLPEPKPPMNLRIVDGGPGAGIQVLSEPA